MPVMTARLNRFRHRLFAVEYFLTGNAARSYQVVYGVSLGNARANGYRVAGLADVQEMVEGFVADYEAARIRTCAGCGSLIQTPLFRREFRKTQDVLKALKEVLRDHST